LTRDGGGPSVGRTPRARHRRTPRHPNPIGDPRCIFEHPTLKSAEINVETFKGRVQLSGFVGTRASMDQAVLVAQGVTGVSSVKNDMRLK
jgi:hypothetical protein